MRIKYLTLIIDKQSTSYTVQYLSENKLIAEVGKISGEYLIRFDIGQDVYYANIDWDLLLKIIKNSWRRLRTVEDG